MVKLVCLLDGFDPKKQQVQWLKNKAPFSGNPETRTLEAQGKRHFTQISEILIDAQQLNEESEYSCQSGQNTSSTWSSNRAHPSLRPLITLKKPRLVAAKTGSEEVKAYCAVEAAPNSRVSWFLDGNKEKRGTTDPPADKPDSNTQLINNTLTLTAAEWEKLQNVTCRVKQPYGKEHQETLGVILEPLVKSPTVEIRRSLGDVVKGDGAVLECFARDLPSGEFSVIFQTDGHQFPDPAYVDLPKGQSTLTTRFTIPPSHQKKNTRFCCKVQQSPSRHWESSFTGNIFGEPSVELLMIANAGKIEPQTLLCYGTGLNPKITWKPTSAGFSKTLMQDDGRVKVSSEINVTRQAWNGGVEYTCQVNDQDNQVEKRIGVCSANEQVIPLINLKKPHLSAARGESEHVTAYCTVKTAPNTKVSWFLNGNKEKQGITQPAADKPDSNTQLITSTLTLSAKEWEEHQNVTCQVKLPCGNEHRETVNILEPWVKTPTVEIRRSLVDLVNGDGAVLECSARDLPSGQLSVTFQADDLPFPNPAHVDLPKGQSTLTTRFTIPPKHQKKDTMFTCKVQQSHSRVWQSASTGNIFGEPSVELLVVPRDPDSEPQTLLCYGTGFQPNIMWLANSEIKNAVTQETTMHVDGRVTVSSKVTVPSDEWNEGVKYTCRVNDYSNLPVQKSVSDCTVSDHLAQPPRAYLLGPSFTVLQSAGQAPLICLVIAHKVKDFTITWKVDNIVQSLHVSEDPPKDHINGSQSVQSRLVLSAKSWEASSDVACEVKHRCFKKIQHLNISKTRDSKRPTVQIIKPGDSDLSDAHDSTLLCLITGFYPADISVHWELNWTKLAVSRWSNSPLGNHFAGRDFSMHSVLTLPRSDRDQGMFSCVVRHQSSQSPIVSSVDNIYASVMNKVPTVKILQARDELVCLAYDYSPSAINITWLLDGVEVPDKHTTRPAKGPDGKFSVKSQIHLLASEWAPGSTYTCQVQHITGTSSQNISKAEMIEENIYFNENMSGAIVEDTAEETWNMACAFIILFLLSLMYGCSVTLVKVNTVRPASSFHTRHFK